MIENQTVLEFNVGKPKPLNELDFVPQPLKVLKLTFLSFRYCEAIKLEYYYYTQGCVLELSFSKSGGGHDKLHISSADTRSPVQRFTFNPHASAIAPPC